jgi:hypothetical protein
MMPEHANRTFICSVLFLDIADYSRKPVSEQIQLKDRFNALIADSIRDIAPNDRIILDTGDGMAVNFLGDPEDALFVAMSLRESFAPRPDEPPIVPARIGINLGPVRLVRDLNSQPNIIGDGINVAQRVMGFAQPGQILVSRSYYEVVLHISEGYTKLFNYEGSRTDKHVREHEVYSVGYTDSGSSAIRSPAERARASTHEGRLQESTATLANGTRSWPLLARIKPWLSNRSVALGTAALSVVAFALALAINLLGHRGVDALSSPSPEGGAQMKAQTVVRLDEKSMSAQHKPDGKKTRPAAALMQSAQPGVNLSEPKAEADEKKDAKPSSFAFFSGAKPDATTAPEAPVAPVAPVAPAAPDANALITLAIAPWGEIFVDGKRMGVSPPIKEVKVAPGRRKLEIKNSSFPVYTQVVEVKAKDKVRIEHKFREKVSSTGKRQ